MKLFNPLAPRWYARLNEAAVVTSILILLGFFGLRYVTAEGGTQLPLSISPISALLATVATLYGVVGYRFLSKKTSLAAGLVSYLLMAATVGTLVVATGGFVSQYLLLWVIVILFSAMFGWLTFSMLWLVTHAYFSLLALNIIGSVQDDGSLVAYLAAIELPFLVSFFMWYGQGVGQNSTSTLTGEIGTDDISQGMLISSIAEGVVVIDDQFRVQVFNPAASQTTGWSELDARGIDYRSVLLLTDKDGNQLLTEQDPVQRVFSKAETIVDNEVRLKTRNGKLVELTFVASPITSKNGSTVAVVSVFRDVSDERQQERQRAEFISTASHEMRTPVAAIEGYLALAMNEQVSKIDSKAREYLEKAHSSTQHLGKLFQDLLTAAKSEDGRLQNKPVVTEIGSFVDELVDNMRFTAEKKGLIMEYDGGQSHNAVAGSQTVRPLYYAHVDSERMREVVTNLFDNAVKYTSEGKITIRLAADENHIVISVSDTGPGIPQEDIPHLFQKFYRVDNTATRQVGGTGLGLFISRKIVEMNNGKIWVESTVNKGSNFYISLPRITAQKAEDLKKQEAVHATPLANVSAASEI